MAHTHEFDCRECGAHFDSRDDLDRHNREKHVVRASSSRSDASDSDSARRDSSLSGQSRNDPNVDDKTLL